MKYKYLIIVFTILLAVPGFAKIVKRGQTGFRFLDNPVSAEAIGRGGLGLTLFYNSNTVFWNPSGLAWQDSKFDFNANYTSGIADINYSSFAGSVALDKFGVLALDFLTMDYGEFQGTQYADNEQGYVKTELFQPGSYAIGFTYSQKVNNRFSYGIRIKYAYQDLGSVWTGTILAGDTTISLVKYNHGEPAIDVGTTYDFLNHGIRFGAVIQNFSREIKYEVDKVPMPYAVSFSLSLNPLSILSLDNENHHLIIGFESSHPRDYLEKIKVGTEYTFQKMLILRTGYMGNYDERGLTFGMGVHKKIDGIKLRLDYAYQDYGIFDATHTFSIGVSY
ncbi:MAG: PorV/PorQ family protein [Candidatus Marinimicrobia bacterium]|nr:PorV/PorQ family protein [Candidatus Neomarinimicrobiota bacterium]